MTVSIGKQKQIVKNAENTEYTAEGVHYNEEPRQFIKVNHGLRKQDLRPSGSSGRVIKTQPAPRIYINDGSNGTNLVYCESYKLYTTSKLTPRVTSSYSNNYPRSETKNTVYNSVDGTKLHPTGDSGGFSDYITLRKK